MLSGPLLGLAVAKAKAGEDAGMDDYDDVSKDDLLEAVGKLFERAKNASGKDAAKCFCQAVALARELEYIDD